MPKLAAVRKKPLQFALAGSLLAAGLAFFLFRDRPLPPQTAEEGPRSANTGATPVYGSPLEVDPEALVPGVPSVTLLREAVELPDAAQTTTPIRVHVIDPDGAGVRGATVRLSPYRKQEPILAEAATDADGRASLISNAGVLDRARLLWSAPELRGGNSDYENLGEEIELRMEWTATLVGTVRDEETGLPLDGVILKYNEGPATTRPDGTYRLERAFIGHKVSLSLRRPGYVPRDIPVLVPNRGEHPMDFEMKQADTLRVRVIDRETGAPISGAELAEYDSGPGIATCDAEGYAVIDTLAGAKLHIIARAPDYVPILWSCEVREIPDASSGAGATFPLRRLAWAGGLVLDPDGQPLQGAGVWSACDKHSPLVHFSEERRAELGLYGYSGDRPIESAGGSDANGAFRVPLSPCDDPVTITITSKLFAQEILGPFPAPSPGETIPVVAKLRQGGKVAGQVVLNGEPWTKGDIIVQSSDGTILSRARIDEAGHYETRPLPAGLVRLQPRDLMGREPPMSAADVTVEADKIVEHDFVLAEEVAWIRGTVRGPDGSPRPTVMVNAFTDDPGATTPHDATKTGVAGAFELKVSPRVLYDVSASIGEAVTVQRTAVPSGTEDLELLLPWVGTLRLRLVESTTGESPGPLEASTWSLAWAKSGESRYRYASGSPDLYGRLSLDVEAGAVNVALHFPGNGYAPAILRDVAVPEGGQSEEAIVKLERGVEAHLLFDTEVESLQGHLLFMLEESQLDMIEGPFREQSGQSHYRIGGIFMRVDAPHLLNQMLEVGDGGLNVTRGLAPGRYHLRAFPNDVLFEPATFDLPAAAKQPISISWRPR